MSSEKFVPIPGTVTEKDFRKKPIEAGLSDYFGLGDEIPDNDVGAFTAMLAGAVDGVIKVPYGFVQLGAEILDAFQEDGIPVDQGYAARLDKAFYDTFVGKISKAAEETARERAAGRLVSAFVQVYNTAKVGTNLTIKGAEKAKAIANKYITAAKNNKVVIPSNNNLKSLKKAKDLNKLSGTQRFAAVAGGGGVGTSFVVDIEDIGTFGDVFGGPTAIDREDRATAQDDAIRKLSNRFKFGTENTLITVPFVYGGKLIGNLLSKQSKDLAYSNSQIERLIDKRLREPFQARGKKDPTLFEEQIKALGRIERRDLTAKDLVKDIDVNLAKVVQRSKPLTNDGTPGRVLGKMDELLFSGQDATIGNRIVFNGFDEKKLKEFKDYVGNFGIVDEQATILVDTLTNVRNAMNTAKNALFGGRATPLNIKEFNEIMSERFTNFFRSEYKIFTNKNFFGVKNYKPTQESINDVKQIIARYGQSIGKVYDDTDLDLLTEGILRNVRQNSTTKTPEFPIPTQVLDDKATQLVNIANSVKQNKFVATDFIKTKSDLKNLERFFGVTRDPRETLFNYIHDLGQLVAKDKFYRNIVKASDEARAKGERAILYPTYEEAVRAFPKTDVISSPAGLQLESKLGKNYVPPVNGYFTRKDFAEALDFAEKAPLEDLAKSTLYRNFILIPKGMAQISKTVLGPFTHSRNFATAGTFVSMNGNLFKNPAFLLKNFKRSFNTVQPQFLYRNLPRDQALYKFLLDERVASSSATYKDITGLFDDIGKGGDVFERIFKGFGKTMSKIYKGAQDLYLAEDDIFKIFSFLAEFDNLKNAHKVALQKGIIKKLPADIALMREAADIVRNTVPNYALTGSFIQASRRSPLGNFVSFASEMVRTTGNSVQLSLKHLNDPIRSGMGARRLFGNAFTLGGLGYVIPEIFRGLYGISKEVLAAVREFLPSFSEDSTIVPYRNEKGEYMYVDVSQALPYDTVTNPLESVVSGVAREQTFDPDSPLIKGFVEGTARGIVRLMRPFVDESIWFSTFNDIFLRGGRTKPTRDFPKGRQIVNPSAPLGDKIVAISEYVTRKLAPGSVQQLERLYDATLNKPSGKYGKKYEVPEELRGFIGLRSVKLDLDQGIKSKIAKFQNKIFDDRKLLTVETARGAPVTENDIIRAYIKANKARYQSLSELKRVVDAANVLKYDKGKLFTTFKKKNLRKTYNFIQANRYQPLNIPEGFKERQRDIAEKLQEDFETQKFRSPVNRKALKQISRIKRKLGRLKLNKNFDQEINVEDYLLPEPGAQSSLPTQAPQTPQPNPAVVTPPVQPAVAAQSGLTPTEEALLSPSEKAIRLRQRGLG
jgi:hypothetical protein